MAKLTTGGDFSRLTKQGFVHDSCFHWLTCFGVIVCFSFQKDLLFNTAYEREPTCDKKSKLEFLVFYRICLITRHNQICDAISISMLESIIASIETTVSHLWSFICINVDTDTLVQKIDYDKSKKEDNIVVNWGIDKGSSYHCNTDNVWVSFLKFHNAIVARWSQGDL